MSGGNEDVQLPVTRDENEAVAGVPRNGAWSRFSATWPMSYRTPSRCIAGPSQHGPSRSLVPAARARSRSSASPDRPRAIATTGAVYKPSGCGRGSACGAIGHGSEQRSTTRDERSGATTE